MPTRMIYAAALAIFAASAAMAADPEIKNPLVEGETWADLKYDIVGDREIADGSALIALDAPYRAEDAAIVPLHLTQTDPDADIGSLMIVIDENPAPLAGDFTFGPGMSPLDFELRVRVNQYSNIRVIADTGDGLVMTGRFVKASGGCSAPASKDPEVALASMGQMRLRSFGDKPAMSNTWREAQIMIRHPNYSGLQRDQITQLFINAHFIDELEVYQGEELLFTMEGGISISENPVFRFAYRDNGAPALRVRARDTEGNIFEQILPKDGEI